MWSWRIACQPVSSLVIISSIAAIVYQIQHMPAEIRLPLVFRTVVHCSIPWSVVMVLLFMVRVVECSCLVRMPCAYRRFGREYYDSIQFNTIQDDTMPTRYETMPTRCQHYLWLPFCWVLDGWWRNTPWRWQWQWQRWSRRPKWRSWVSVWPSAVSRWDNRCYTAVELFIVIEQHQSRLPDELMYSYHYSVQTVVT